MKKYRTIFLVAMEFEVENIFGRNGFVKLDERFPFEVFTKGEMAVIKTGVSKTFASSGTQWSVDNFEADRWINVGLCGSLNDRFGFGETVLVSECRFHDLDVRGLTPECKIGQISPEKEYKFALNTDIGIKMEFGKCITGDIFVIDKSKFSEIIDEYSPDLVEMELAAIAQVMSLNGQLDKLYSIKVVSDKANEKAGDDFGKIEDKLFVRIREIVDTLTGN